MKKRARGFSLIELIIYTAIIGVVIGSIVSFALTVSNLRQKNVAQEAVQANLRVALKAITQAVRRASSINVASSQFNADPGVLELSYTNEPLKDPMVISLTSDNGALEITENADVATPTVYTVTSDDVRVTNLVFSNVTPVGGAGTVRIFITIAREGGSQAASFVESAATTVNVRR